MPLHESIDHSCRATMPASRPYVSPDEVENLNTKTMARVTSTHSRTDTDEPKASHDHAGWWRRGHQRNNRAMAATRTPTPIGHRRMFQAVSSHPLLSCSPTAEPKPMATNTMA